MLFGLRGPQSQIGGGGSLDVVDNLGYFMLCVVSVVTMMVIGTDIRSHDIFVHNIKILSYVHLN
jgi:hypothetical protein